MKTYSRRVFSFLIIIGLVCMPLIAFAEELMEDSVNLDNEMTINLEEKQKLKSDSPMLEVTAGNIHSGDYWYTDIPDGARITSYTGSGGHVDIPSTIDGKNVLEIGSDAFNGNTTLLGVNLPNTVTTLGLRSFYNCQNLYSVFLGNGLNTIGNGSFWGAKSLTSIHIPFNVFAIGYAAFSNCSALKKISILNSSTSFDGEVFANVPGLTIYGYSGSTANDYASVNNQSFVAFPYGRGISYYSTHVQNVGWQSERMNGEISGTVGQGLRLEGIRIKLEDVEANKFDIYYRVHAENYGWLDWAKNGESAGTQGMGLRLEGIQIIVVIKNSAAPGRTLQPFVGIV